MMDLLSSMSLEHLLIFVVLSAIAFKEVVDFISWFKEKMELRDKGQEKKKSNLQRLDTIEENLNQLSTPINELSEKVDLLIQSDKDDIKAFITREHHYFCYQVGSIDDYSLDCIEKRYGHYVEEKGNSFVEQLMSEIRSLPRKPREDYK